jgi:hypothetical protein
MAHAARPLQRGLGCGFSPDGRTFFSGGSITLLESVNAAADNHF